MKLELKHLAGYLPYGLKIKTTQGWSTMKTLNDWSVNGDCEESYSYETEDTTDFKPILHPLSDLTIDKYFEMTGKSEKEYFALYFANNRFYKQGYSSRSFETFETLPYHHILELLENHFDIHGLIENGLAIDINTLK